MSIFIEMLSYKKGDGNTHKPEAGEVCLVSPPHCDDEKGYVYSEQTCVWRDDVFAVFKADGYWPNVYKWEHIRCKPITTPIAER